MFLKILVLFCLIVVDCYIFHTLGVHWPTAMLVGTWMLVAELLNAWDDFRGRPRLRFMSMPDFDALSRAADELAAMLEENRNAAPIQRGEEEVFEDSDRDRDSGTDCN